MAAQDNIHAQFHELVHRPFGSRHHLVAFVVRRRGEMMVRHDDPRGSSRHVAKCLGTEFQLARVDAAV